MSGQKRNKSILYLFPKKGTFQNILIKRPVFFKVMPFFFISKKVQKPLPLSESVLFFIGIANHVFSHINEDKKPVLNYSLVKLISLH